VIDDRVVMERPYWTNEEVLTELRGLNLTELVDFGIDRLVGSGTTLLCLAHGNINATTV
jgi:secreted Zn-dependent insulinase-like peptidase